MDDETIPVCGGTFDALDLHARLVRDAMLLEGRDRVIDYSIGDGDFIGDYCGTENAAGCAHPESGDVLVVAAFTPHEIVHAARALDPEIRHLSQPVEEGLATLFGSDVPGLGVIPLDVLDILEDRDMEGLDEYYRAGHVIAAVFQLYGIEAFRQFDLLARGVAENDAFLSAFGETKVKFAERAETMPVCQSTQWWMPVLECDGDADLPDPKTGRIVLSGDVRCGEVDVVGPNPYGAMWTSRHFRVTEKTFDLLYEIDMPEDSTLEIVGCQYGCPDRFVYRGGARDVGGITKGIPSLEPGEYFLRMSRPVSDDDGHFEVVL